jgi:hypothetical protein
VRYWTVLFESGMAVLQNTQYWEFIEYYNVRKRVSDRILLGRVGDVIWVIMEF